MNCYDCELTDQNSPAIGTCVNCGAGVCAQHVQLVSHELPHAASPGNYTHLATRSLNCQACAAVTLVPAPALHARATTAR